MILNLLSTLVVDQADDEKKQDTTQFVHMPQAVHSTEMVDSITFIVEKL